MIVIVDYGVGNLHSVLKAVEKTGAQAKISCEHKDIQTAAKLILPGVGSFGQCMKNLAAYQLVEAVQDYAASGRPFLGICVGLQLLFSESAESPEIRGLGILPGKIVRLPAENLKIPQIGWNSLQYRTQSPLYKNLPENEYVYFVHSYYAQPEEKELISATTNYGGEITASVSKNNIQAVQFHPEKSGEVGLKILANFKEM